TGCCLCLRHGVRWIATPQGKKRESISQPSVRSRILRIFSDRGLEVLSRGSQIGSGAFVGEICALEITLMRRSVFGWSSCNRPLLQATKSCSQGVGDCFCDLALHAKDVRQFAIIFFCPKM